MLWYLKDADGLDRARLYDLDPRYLRHEEALRWVSAAERLYRGTDHLEHPPTIWQVALDQDLPIEELLEFVQRQGANLIGTSREPAHE